MILNRSGLNPVWASKLWRLREITYPSLSVSFLSMEPILVFLLPYHHPLTPGWQPKPIWVMDKYQIHFKTMESNKEIEGNMLQFFKENFQISNAK